MNELDLYFPHTECNGKDCIIIPADQIACVEITISTDDNPEMILTVRGKHDG